MQSQAVCRRAVGDSSLVLSWASGASVGRERAGLLSGLCSGGGGSQGLSDDLDDVSHSWCLQFFLLSFRLMTIHKPYLDDSSTKHVPTSHPLWMLFYLCHPCLAAPVMMNTILLNNIKYCFECVRLLQQQLFNFYSHISHPLESIHLCLGLNSLTFCDFISKTA